MSDNQYRANEIRGLARNAEAIADAMEKHPDLPGPLLDSFGAAGLARMETVRDLLTWVRTLPGVKLQASIRYVHAVAWPLHLFADAPDGLVRPREGMEPVTVEQVEAALASGMAVSA